MLAGALLLALTISIFVVAVLQPIRWLVGLPGRAWEAAKNGLHSLWEFLTGVSEESPYGSANETAGIGGAGNHSAGGVGG